MDALIQGQGRVGVQSLARSLRCPKWDALYIKNYNEN